MADRIMRNQDTILRSTDQQQTTRRLRNLLYEGPTERLLSHRGPGASTTWPTQVDEAAQTVTTRPQPGLRLQSFEVHNGTGGGLAVGVGFRLRNEVWECGDWDDSVSGSDYQGAEADYQSRTARTLWADIGTPAANDGIVVCCDKPFSWVSINVTTASVDGDNSSDWGIRYTDAAGTAWVALTASSAYLDGWTQTNGELATGEMAFAWAPPHDWGTVAEAGFEGLPIGRYCLQFRTTGDIPDGTDPIVTGVEIGTMMFSGAALASDGIYENEEMSWVDFDADGVVAFFATADAQNAVGFEVSPAG